MIDRDEMRIARRTVERNGYTVLPPREKDEEDLSRYRSRRDMERRPARPVRKEDDYEESQPRFKPLRSRHVEDEEPVRRPVRRPVEDDFDDEPVRRPIRKPVSRNYEDEDDYEPVRKTPVRRPEPEDDDYEPVRKPIRQTEPERKPMSDLERAKRTAEFNGYTVTKMSRLDQAKQVAKDAGFEVRKAPKPTASDDEGSNDRPIRRMATRDGAPMHRPVVNREMAKANRDAVRTRTAPDVEIKDQQTKVDTPVEQPAPKKPSFEDDYVNRAAAFFGDDD